ncbi:MAG: hypothetical protein M0026_15170 [Nocardiopsaceae bacterium]|nr:hypothetical protein [Nocardiopsaceae bacterium]
MAIQGALPVEFEQMSVMPYVDDNGRRPRVTSPGGALVSSASGRTAAAGAGSGKDGA